MFFADLHCDFLSKAAHGASFERPGNGQAISRQAVTSGDLRLLGMAAFCGDSRILSREEMLASVKAQIEAYETVTQQRDDGRYLAGTQARALLTLEGLDYLQSVQELEEFLQKDVASVGIMWNRASALGGSVHEDASLTALGRETVLFLERCGVKVDLAHAGRRTFYDVMDCCERPFVSHSNVYSVTEHPRNLDDAQIRMLIERRGLLGISFYVPFVGGDTYGQLRRHIEHVLDLGGQDILAFGSDFDGCDQTVRGLDTAGKYNAFAEYLRLKGMSSVTLEKLCFANAATFFHGDNIFQQAEKTKIQQ